MHVIRREGYDPARLLLEETLFHSANGYLGVRAAFEEGYEKGLPSVRGTYVNAFHDLHEIRHPEKLFGFPEEGERIVAVTDAQGIELVADGERVLVTAENGASLARVLDLDRGIATRSFRHRTKGGALLEIEVRRLCSQEEPCLFAVGYRVACLEGAAVLRLDFLLEGEVANHFDEADPRLSGSAFKSLDVLEIEAVALPHGGELAMESRTRGTGFTLAVVSGVEARGAAAWSCRREGSRALLGAAFALGAGEAFEATRRNVYADSIRHGDAMGAARRVSATLLGRDFDSLAEAHALRVRAFWEGAEVSVEGDPSSDEGLRFGLFELLQSAPRDGRSNIPAKGLSGEGYEGHYFWDTEIYMAPFFTYTAPERARTLLSYRHSILEGARRHARRMGQRRGAAFPWRTIAGRECSAYYPSGSSQYHINADIAYSLWRYWEATGDLDFLAGIAAELLFETARTWLEIGHFLGGRFLIEAVTGPDEYTCLVDNNFYTNAMARFHLARAVEARSILAASRPAALAAVEARIGLEASEPELWQRAAEAMYLPHDAERDLTPQDDGFLSKAPWDPALLGEEDRPLLLHYHHLAIIRRQVCKQADAVLAHFLLPGVSPESTVRNSYNYYEKITTHDSSLSYAIFSAMAARLGDAAKALRYFRETVRLDLDDSHGNAKDGIHAANMGGSWLALVFGFGGFRPGPDGPSFDPLIPEAWTAYSFRVVWRGSSLRLRVRKGAGGAARAEVELASGPPLDILLRGRRVRLDDRILE